MKNKVIYKCGICGEENKADPEADFETSSPFGFIEHLQEHMDIFVEMLSEKDDEIEVLKTKIDELNKFKFRPASKSELSEPKYPAYKKKFKHRRTKIDDGIKEIFTNHYKSETPQQIQKRILDETGKNIHISTIYNWASKQRREDRAKANTSVQEEEESTPTEQDSHYPDIPDRAEN